MTRFKGQGFNNTFKNARKGFRLVLKSEINVRIHVVIAFLVLFFAYLLDFSAIEYCKNQQQQPTQLHNHQQGL